MQTENTGWKVTVCVCSAEIAKSLPVHGGVIDDRRQFDGYIMTAVKSRWMWLKHRVPIKSAYSPLAAAKAGW